MKPTPIFVAAMLILATVILGLWIYISARNAYIDRAAEKILMSERQLYRHRQLDCEAGVELWNCLIFANGETQ